jgi:hypothetical protein
MGISEQNSHFYVFWFEVKGLCWPQAMFSCVCVYARARVCVCVCVCVFFRAQSVTKGRRRSVSQTRRDSDAVAKMGSTLEASMLMQNAAPAVNFMDGPLQEAINELTRLVSGDTRVTEAIMKIQKVIHLPRALMKQRMLIRIYDLAVVLPLTFTLQFAAVAALCSHCAKLA